jgi:uroporphyrinogen III methyltransferase/synthase
LRCLAKVQLACIGPGTTTALRSYHLKSDLVPDEYRAEALAEALAPDAHGKRFLLIRASRGREVLVERLIAAGGEVEQVVTYTSKDSAQADAEILSRLQQGEIDWVTVTSSAIARSLVGMFGDDLRKTQLASISPLTSGLLRELKHPPTVEAEQYTMDGVVQAICTKAHSN